MIATSRLCSGNKGAWQCCCRGVPERLVRSLQCICRGEVRVLHKVAGDLRCLCMSIIRTMLAEHVVHSCARVPHAATYRTLRSCNVRGNTTVGTCIHLQHYRATKDTLPTAAAMCLVCMAILVHTPNRSSIRSSPPPLPSKQAKLNLLRLVAPDLCCHGAGHGNTTQSCPLRAWNALGLRSTIITTLVPGLALVLCAKVDTSAVSLLNHSVWLLRYRSNHIV